MAVGCQMQIIAQKTHYCTQLHTRDTQIADYCPQETFIALHWRKLHVAREPTTLQEFKNIKFGSNKFFVKIHFIQMVRGHLLPGHLWTLTPPGPSLYKPPCGISSLDISSPSKLMSGGANVCLYPYYSLSYRA